MSTPSTIPNPLNDHTVQNDIEDTVKRLTNASLGIGNIDEHIRYLVREAARWGIREGFRMGWRLGENAGRKARI